jgi:hypothetical protein
MLLYVSVKNHFEDYLRYLRSGEDLTLRKNFKAVVELKWALNEKERAIGMTEEEFYRT